MKAVILVGGQGTRLRPVTYLNPKPMLPLMNRPFMYSFVSWLKSHGLTDIIFSTCYLPEIFNDYFSDGERFGLELTYITEDSPLGTCGAVKNVEGHLDGDPFMVFNGDILTSLDLTDMKTFRGVREFYVHINQSNSSGIRGNVSSNMNKLEIDAAIVK